TADGWEKAGLIDFPAEALAQEFAAVPELELTRRPLTPAVRPTGADAPQLRPALHAPGEARPLGHDITWHVGPAAGAEGVVRWSRDAAVAPGEVGVPAPVTVADVRAADLVGWSHSGPRVQVWFRTAVKDPTVR